MRIKLGTCVALGLFGAPSLAHAEWETRSVGGVSTRVYTPATSSPVGDGRALMIVLHGCAQTADQLRDFGNFEPAAEAFGFVVALPSVPGGGVVAGCWDYYGASHSRQSGHNGPLIAMTEALRDDDVLGLDPDQLYLVGFSSGGGQALVTGCLAPELFAGIGISAGPSLGTGLTQIAQVATNGTAAANLCEQFAGPNVEHLTTQIGSAFTDTGDFTVAQGYALVNAEMFATVIGPGLAGMTSSPLDVAALAGASPAGTGTVYADDGGPRVAWIQSSGVGHAWPAGSGEATGFLTFVSGNGLNYSMFLAEFFAANNRRVAGGPGPGDGSGDSGSGSGSDDSGDAGTEDGGGSDDAGDSEAGDATNAGSDDTIAADTAAGETDPGQVEPSGCQCRASSDHAPRWGWLASLGMLGLRRRRVGRRA